MSFLRHMCTGVKSGESILSHQNPDDNNVGMACTSPPSDTTINTSLINKGGENEAPGLVGGCFGKNRNDQGNCARGMPPDRDIIQVLKEMNPESVDHALNEKNCGIYANGTLRSRYKICAESADSG